MRLTVMYVAAFFQMIALVLTGVLLLDMVCFILVLLGWIPFEAFLRANAAVFLALSKDPT